MFGITAVVEPLTFQPVSPYATFDGQTKWDLMASGDRDWARRTAFNGSCSGCGESLPTEEAFAKHFIIEIGYRNLGYCPVKGRK